MFLFVFPSADSGHAQRESGSEGDRCFHNGKEGASQPQGHPPGNRQRAQIQVHPHAHLLCQSRLPWAWHEGESPSGTTLPDI